MEKRIRFLILSLIGLLLFVIGYAFYILNSKEVLKRQYVQERSTLTKENEELTKKVNGVLQEKKNLDTRFQETKAQLDKINGEQQELQGRYDLLVKQNKELEEKIKSMPKAEPGSANPQEFSAPAGQEAYWGNILKTKADLEVQLQELRGKLKETAIEQDKLRQEKGMLTLEMNNVNRENQDLKRQLEFTKKEMSSKLGHNQLMLDSLASDVVREKTDKLNIQESMQPLRQENSLLRRQVKFLSGRKIILEKKIAGLEEKHNLLQKKLSEMEVFVKEKNATLDDLTQKVEAATAASAPETVSSAPAATAPHSAATPQKPAEVLSTESVELPPIIVRPSQETVSQATESLAAKVIAVNREHNFVVIDLGEDSGIKVGDVFQVYKGGQAIATVQVMQLRRSIAACDIKKEVFPVKIGDVVK
jgi:septal ring factor EnvC (AmiA/AmiB activator)